MKPTIRLVRPWGPRELDLPEAFLSTEIPADHADALVCEWAPSEELLRFSGPAAWYNCEPWTHPRMGIHAHPDQRAFLSRIEPHQLLHHAAEDASLRVPHVTHRVTGDERYDGPRERAAAAVVSNAGGPPSNRWPDVELRNAFVTARGVRLFGRRGKWRWYRATRTSWPRTPSSYAGEVGEGMAAHGVTVDRVGTNSLDDWGKIALFARHHAVICLENTCEPWYFTEKFVDAVRADCVPVYRAHPTVRDGALRGAAWVDPGDFDLDPTETIAYALTLDRAGVAERNRAWLENAAVRATSFDAVWSRIARLVLGRSDRT